MFSILAVTDAWSYLTIPVGVFVSVVTFCFVVSFFRVMFSNNGPVERGLEATITAEVDRAINEHFQPISIEEVWKIHDAGQELRLYRRIR